MDLLDFEKPYPEVLHTGKCSGILISFRDAAEALRDVPQAWEWSSPKAGFTQGHRAGLYGAELSAHVQDPSRSCFETSNSRIYSDALKEALGPFIFPAYVL